MKKYLLIGHSHIGALRNGYLELEKSGALDFQMRFMHLRAEEFRLLGENKGLASKAGGVDQAAVFRRLDKEAPDAAILNLNGNAHNVLGLFGEKHVKHDEKIQLLGDGVRSTLTDWLRLLTPHLPSSAVITFPPPPIESEERIRELLRGGLSALADAELEPGRFRLDLYDRQCQCIREVASEWGLVVVELPKNVFTPGGFLALDCIGNDPTHANTEYGRRVVPSIVRELQRMESDNEAQALGTTKADFMKRHPYEALPDYCYWRQAVSELDMSSVDPVTHPRFTIRPKERVATAGSCFAQHISKRLRASGFNFYLAEQPVTLEGGGRVQDTYDFSARYGNVYTARQLLQLFDRAFGYFRPIERVWALRSGGYCDPFRPRIEPNGFDSEETVMRDTKIHLAAVRRMFKRLDVFVFTLGMTECWASRLDGAVYPIAPGVVGGEYNPDKHVFMNFSMGEVESDLRVFLAKLRLVNPAARVILTVSPVPLMATAENRHVLVSNSYSKSVLRVAAEAIVNSHDNVCYFPSYEIVTGQHAGNAYYGSDRRSVTERGVDHVMRVFMSRMTDRMGGATETAEADRMIAEIEALVEVACDEEMLVR